MCCFKKLHRSVNFTSFWCINGNNNTQDYMLVIVLQLRFFVLDGNNSKDADISSSSSDSNIQVSRIPQQKQQTVEDTSKATTVKDQRYVLQSRENLTQRSKSSCK